MPISIEYSQLIDQVSQKLSILYPEMEFEHSDPESFFIGYFDFPGFPHDPWWDFTPAWFQEGRVLNWQTVKPYLWDNDRFEFQSVDNDDKQIYVNFIFIHEDGSVSTINEDNGQTHRVLRQPTANELINYVELFFEAGRKRQKEIAPNSPPAITGVSLPFFHFPDDFSHKLISMPVVSFHKIKDTVFRHIAAEAPWLFAMRDYTTQLKQLKENIEAKESAENIGVEEISYKLSINIDSEEGSLSCSGEEFIHSMLASEQKECEKARPLLMADAANLTEEVFNWNWKNENHLQWNLPYFSLANNEYLAEETLPLCLHLSDSVFAPFLTATYCRKSYQQVYTKLSRHLKSIDSEPSSIVLDLPDYHEQVLNCFLQEACLTQGPELAKKALESRPDSALKHTESLSRRLKITKRLLKSIQ